MLDRFDTQPGQAPRWPGEPEDGHWARGVYHRFRVYLQAERGLAPLTVRNYLTDLEPFWRFLDGQGVDDLAAVDRSVVRGYFNWLLKDASPKGPGPAGQRGAGYARRSVVRKQSTLRALFRFLASHAEVSQPQASHVVLAKQEQPVPRFLDGDGVTALLAAPGDTPQGLRDSAILEMLYAAGLRVSEITGLNVEDVDLEAGQVRVMGKGSKQRMGLLGGPARRALDRYLAAGRPQIRESRFWRDFGALFLNRNGGRLTARSVQLLVRKYAAQAGLEEGVHPHTLRHSFATHLLDGGADVRVVQELLGHTTPATTQIYTHVTQSAARLAYRKAHPRAAKQDGAEGAGDRAAGAA